MQNQSTTKILVVGNNDDSTDREVVKLAQQHATKNHGLITQSEFVPVLPGYYHTTVTDIAWSGLLTLAERFDTILMLDQPQNQWSHWKCMQATCKLMLKLEQSGKHTIFRDNANIQKILYWTDLLHNKNSSMCIYPWINFNNVGSNLKLCARDQSTVTTIDNLKDWATDPSYTSIRQ
jgi:hypothetical protein